MLQSLSMTTEVKVLLRWGTMGKVGKSWDPKRWAKIGKDRQR